MEKFKNNALIIFLYLLLVVFFWFVYEYSKAHQFQRTFTVIGQGKEVAMPNIAEIRIGVITEGNDLRILQEENSKKINKIINFLKEEGIDNKDIKTENYSITPKYDYKNSPYQIIGYTLNQSLIVKVRDLNKIGYILTNAVKYGANNVFGPNFTIDEPEDYLDKAREKAIIDAKQKAEKIAKTAGFKLGKIIGISEYLHSQPEPFYSTKEFTDISLKVTPQIESGYQEIKVQVSITFKIN